MDNPKEITCEEFWEIYQVKYEEHVLDDNEMGIFNEHSDNCLSCRRKSLQRENDRLNNIVNGIPSGIITCAEFEENFSKDNTMHLYYFNKDAEPFIYHHHHCARCQVFVHLGELTNNLSFVWLFRTKLCSSYTPYMNGFFRVEMSEELRAHVEKCSFCKHTDNVRQLYEKYWSKNIEKFPKVYSEFR
jgi:hypothetical protein